MKFDPGLYKYLKELLCTISLYPQAQRDNEESRIVGIKKMLEYQEKAKGN